MMLRLDILNTNADEDEWNALYELSGRTYFIRFFWDARDGYWYISLFDQDEQPIAQGIKLVPNVRLLRRFLDVRLPPGGLVLVDVTGAATAPGRNDLGIRHRLDYWDGDTTTDPVLT